MAELQTKDGCKGSPKLKFKDLIPESRPTPAARTVAAFLDNLDDEEANNIEGAARLEVNIISISMNDPAKLTEPSQPTSSHSLLDSLYEFEELQENMDILPANIITATRARYTAKTVPDYSKTYKQIGSDLICLYLRRGR